MPEKENGEATPLQPEGQASSADVLGESEQQPGPANPSGGVPIAVPFSPGEGVTEEEIEQSGRPER